MAVTGAAGQAIRTAWPLASCWLSSGVGKGTQGWLCSEGWENLGAQFHRKTDEVPPLIGQLVHYFKNQFNFLPQIRK